MKVLQVPVHSGGKSLGNVEITVPENREEVDELFSDEVVVDKVVESMVTKARNSKRADVTKEAMADDEVKVALANARKRALAKLTA